MTVAAPATRWIEPQIDQESVARLAAEFGLSPLIAGVLLARGHTTPETLEKFLDPRLEHLHDPAMLPDFEPAVKAILGARERGELIYVHGDYDADGVTSAALLTRFLRSIGCEVHVHVPHRMKEGYGIHKDAVRHAISLGAKLFLSCDCGVAAHEQVDMAKAAGMRVVITDHHAITRELPAADAVINPHRTDSKYPFSELAGVGVAFKLCGGLTRELGHKPEHFYRAFVDLAAIGTVADVMPLIDENRVIVRHGLAQLPLTKKVGLRTMLSRVLNNSPKVTCYDLGYKIGPRLNAAGRIDDAALALALLIENEVGPASALVDQLEELNIERRAEQQRITEQAIQLVMDGGFDAHPIIAIANPGWHKGLVGLVAGKLAERFNRPAFVGCLDPETGGAHGSARSIPGFDLSMAIEAHRSLLAGGGGHAAAAGFSVDGENCEEFFAQLRAFGSQHITPEMMMRAYEVDLVVDATYITLQSLEELQRLEPFGMGNREPLLMTRGMVIYDKKLTKTGEHVSLGLRGPTGSVHKAMAFNLADQLADVPVESTIDVVFNASINEFNGSRTAQWQIRDFRVVA